MSTVGILLAAGSGSRFSGGVHKLLAPLRGRPVAAWAIESLCRAPFAERAIVVGATDLSALIPPELAVIVNPLADRGQATSLAAAVAYAAARGHDALVIGLADQPFVPSAAWEAVAAADATPIATATFAGARRPPVRLAARVWDALPSEGDEGARLLMRAHPELVTEVPCPGRPVDIDTAEDLDRADARPTPDPRS